MQNPITKTFICCEERENSLTSLVTSIILEWSYNGSKFGQVRPIYRHHSALVRVANVKRLKVLHYSKVYIVWSFMITEVILGFSWKIVGESQISPNWPTKLGTSAVFSFVCSFLARIISFRVYLYSRQLIIRRPVLHYSVVYHVWSFMIIATIYIFFSNLYEGYWWEVTDRK